MLRKSSVLFTIMAIAFWVAGCFEYEEELIINRDGSGTLTVHYSKWKDVQIDDDRYDFPEDEDEIRNEIEEKWTCKRVKLVDLQVRDRDKSQDVDFTLQFKDVRDLNEVEQFAESEIEFNPGRHCRFQRVIYAEGDWNFKNSSTFEQVIKSIIEESVLDKLKFRFEVKMPQKINKNNANWIRNERNAVWKFTATDLIEGDIKMVANCK